MLGQGREQSRLRIATCNHPGVRVNAASACNAAREVVTVSWALELHPGGIVPACCDVCRSKEYGNCDDSFCPSARLREAAVERHKASMSSSVSKSLRPELFKTVGPAPPKSDK